MGAGQSQAAATKSVHPKEPVSDYAHLRSREMEFVPQVKVKWSAHLRQSVGGFPEREVISGTQGCETHCVSISRVGVNFV